MVSYRATATDRFDSRVEATPVAVSQCRTAFEQWLRDTGTTGDTVHELSIVFSELVTNAVEASPAAHPHVEASAWTEDGSIVLRVANPVTPAPVTEPDLDDPLRTGGRGLLIVRAYTDTLTTELANKTLVIRCARRISA